MMPTKQSTEEAMAPSLAFQLEHRRALRYSPGILDREGEGGV